MLVGIHQLHYLPWLRYFEKIARTDVFVVLDNIQYNKNGWQNRNKVKGQQGPLLLTAPICDQYQQRLDEARIDNRRNWAAKHWKSLQQCYGKTPYFDRYASFFEDTYAQRWEYLNDLNRHMLGFYLQALGITTRTVYASTLPVPGEATDRLVNLIRAVEGTAYYSGAYALDAYLDAEVLSEAGVDLVLQEWKCPVYPQRYGDFVADLSIVDLLMNCGPDSLGILLSETHQA